MASLYDSLTWQHLPIPGAAAAPDNHVSVGTVGEGEPSALLIAGTHGDEGPWSALAIHALLQHPRECLRGALRVVFTANPLAAQANTRNAPVDSPNCVDLDGCFPGNPSGSHSERIASALAPIVESVDMVLDLHGGGSWCVNAFTKEFEGSKELTAAFSAAFYTAAPNKPGGLTTFARSKGAKVINVEVGGRGKSESAWRDQIATGLERALHGAGILKLSDPPSPGMAGTKVGPSQAVRTSHAGVFVPEVSEDAVGTIVAKGTVLGRVYGLDTFELKQTITAPHERTALLLLRAHTCVVEGGALVYVLAEPA